MPKSLLIVLLLFISFNLQAQTWEIGGSIGGSGYMGDLNPNNPLKISGIAAGGFVKRNFDRYLALKLNYTYGDIQGNDANSSNQQFRDRNLNFYTGLSEVALIGEFNFMEYLPNVSNNRYTPFIYLGIGTVRYNPQADYQGQRYDLRPLTTEGEAKPYSNSAISIPYGVGIKYNVSGKWNLIADLGYRQPNTDYLDDVSGTYPNPAKLPSDLARALSDRSAANANTLIGTQRGDGRGRDTYLFLQFTVSYTFVTQNCYFEK
jgi:hypothetical protein